MSAENRKPERKLRGRPFAKGVSGNPGGRPKGWQEAREACRALDDASLKVLVRLMNKSKSDMVKLMAATRIRDEAWGKPAQVVTGEGGGPIQFAASLTDEQLSVEAAKVIEQQIQAAKQERPS